jgi:glutaredoxin-like protein
MRQQDKNIVIYTTSWCPDCHRTRHFLDEHGIEYINIDVEQDGAGMEFVKSVNHGRRVVPTVVFPDGQILVEPPNSAMAAKLGVEETLEDFPRL